MIGDQWVAFQQNPNGAPPIFADRTLDSRSVIHGASRLFYNTQEHANCTSVSLLRNCSDGVLDGDPAYAYANCNAPAQDIAPNAFSFTDQTDVALSTTISSNILQISGITGDVSVSISGQGSPQYRICSNSSCGSVLTGWTSGAATIQNNQYLQLQLTSSSSASTQHRATVTVGTLSDQWDVTTIAQDNTPDSFSFTNVTGQNLNTDIISNGVAINGIGPNAVTVGVTGEGTPRIRINGGGWVSSGTISNGQTLEVRLRSANAENTKRTATVTVGTGSATWEVTTYLQDNTPDSFSFLNLTGQAMETQILSDVVTITGIGPSTASVTISGDGSPQFSVNGGSWRSVATNITNGQTLRLRLTTPNTLNTTRTATVTVGTVSQGWDVTTVTTVPPGQHLQENGGTRNFVVPAGVTSISVVAVGKGGLANGATGGRGADLRWRNNIPVTPGETLKISVDSGAGGAAKLLRDTTELLSARGGDSGTSTALGGGVGGGNGGAAGVGSGYYGGGGGGAGGYAGNGGAGGAGSGGKNGANGAGGGGGGGGGNGSPPTVNRRGAAGGGVGMMGQGTNGTGGAGSTNGALSHVGTPGSNGTTIEFGAGKGGHDTTSVSSKGAVRIIWGAGRSFPNTNTGDM